MAFLGPDYLLSNRTGRRLYHEVAAELPIVDPHNHLSATTVAENERFESIVDLWLNEDHYKWRLMRAHGTDERLITGDAFPQERFKAFASALEAAPLNPLYAWSHLELRRVFGVEMPLMAKTASLVYGTVNERIKGVGVTPRGLLSKFNVQVACSTDDPADSLADHARANAAGDTRLLPTFRPDAVHAIADPKAFDAYVKRLAEAAEIEIRSPATLLEAVVRRHAAFHEAGCRASDHGLDGLDTPEYDSSTIERIWQRVRAGRRPDAGEIAVFRHWIVREVAELNAAKGWVMQLHLGPYRDANSRLSRVGSDVGGDTVGNPLDVVAVARFLNELDGAGLLPKTVLYTIRLGDLAALASIAGAFNDGSAPGKVQIGPAWWFSDTEQGIRAQLRMIAESGLLGHAIGMVTDSRSFLSFTRHEYYRRIVCDEIGRDVERGLLMDDPESLSRWVRGLCGANATIYFGF